MRKKQDANCLKVAVVLENLRRIPYNQFRSNKYKIERESWCVAKMLDHLSCPDYLICTNPSEADSTDIIVISPNKRFKVQIVEIAPKSKDSNNIFKSALAHGYSTLKSEMLELLKITVQNKEVKYSDADKQDLNLLIYFNPPVRRLATNSPAWTIMLDPKLDLDLPNIKAFLDSSKFGSILLLTGDKTFFLKNNKLI